MPNTITMTRSGEFSIIVRGDSHCSTAPDGQATKVKFDFRIVCDTFSLDKRGFLVDQLTVGQYFADLRETELSCEELVIDCGEELVRIAKNENPKIKIIELELKLAPAPYIASMVYSRVAPLNAPLVKQINKKRGG